MIKKVLVAEDHEIVNISVQKTLEDLAVQDISYAYYCDDALYKITQAFNAGNSYDLLITDLHFEADGHKQTLSGGIELITAARKVQPDLRILIFSLENRTAVIDNLYKNYHIDGFVAKARNDARALKEAINEIGQYRNYYPHHYRQSTNKKNAYSFSEYDINIITLLAQGMLIKDIPKYLQQKGIKPSGLSTIEKRLNQMKEALGFTKNEQLVAYCKDTGAM
ncbi:DNA-binding response regulator, NarL/FixJ family, contains REC and HTH domains [Chitinophaga jiangningensis]|uniref:DNA-binding response regulator, NarL/FixJ family, contains REC and HTH domains n=1 Tax=Chitinophaga jiangningensis TaxID=1419482 RepID=A0A1M6Y7E4_9BACT|nr:response regulator [Chitinophaga jiangningensis]SHL14137.1 DNA-binding response regulator, NarL/FixJ family, contains REC and HTH domains [Chitinophaga jiangningensis]